MVVESAIDLNLRDRAEPHADTDERKSKQVSFQAGHRILDAAAVVQSSLDEQPAGTDRFRILSDQWALLCEQHRWLHYECSYPEESNSHQNCRLLSTSTVTGPSLTNSTCIIAWNSPVATTRPAERNSLTTPSYVARAMSGEAASSNDGRRPLRMSPYSVNCETTSTAPPTSATERSMGLPASLSNTRTSRI